MTRIGATFDRLRSRGEKALITFITAGDPDLDETAAAIVALAKGGADIVELGVPFSDPMADGPTIQKSSERGLKSGTTLAAILTMVKKVRVETQIPIVLMGYYNPVFRYGLSQFVQDATESGVDGLLLVDLPPEEAAELKSAASAANLDLIQLLTPTSDEARISLAAAFGSGFIYYVSVTGVTGARASVSDSITSQVQRIRKQSDLPVVVGFGISNAEQAGEAAAAADGAVVGSAIVRLFEEHAGQQLMERLTGFAGELKRGLAPA